MTNKDLLTFLDVNSSVPKLSPVGFVALSVFLGFIMTFGFLNNFVVLVLFCKFKKLRTPVNVLLLNISVSDMLVCLCGTTLSFASSVRGRWLLGRSGCMWYGFINSCFGYSAIMGLNEHYAAMPKVEETLAGYLSPTSAAWRKPALPSKPCTAISALVGKAYIAAGQANASLHTMAVLQAYQADLLREPDCGGLNPNAVSEICRATDLALRATKQTA
ncbi:hypothetical protein QTP70_004648 [Hemibagrus guttatus]|uniref:G-protein coupled receptors family 1 profile domain-containing protein n=1 Tax=Hemibagrus guttatus TaxID=175788 RepID=A0AAE0R5D1_9TELE|nr:hypothetical protein QTP70_004648 [Hemibagrus guttatus]